MSEKEIIAKFKCAFETLSLSGVAFEVAVVDEHKAELLGEEKCLVEAWAPTRQREFASGRQCARRALATLGLNHAELLPDADGIPQWPKGVIGSISHSRGVAMAVVAQSSDITLLGLDLEKTNRLSTAAMKRVVHSFEEAFVGCDQLRASILFSLKEAFYKAQFPKWRTEGNFRDLALELDLDKGLASVLEIDERFAPELAQVQFNFRLVDDYVLCMSWLP